LLTAYDGICHTGLLTAYDGICHTGLLTAYDGICHTGLLTTRKLSANLYDIYHCRVYSETLLMMDKGTVRSM